ncbi:MAG: AAA family ATPase [Caldilineaceae bacterium]
MRISQLELHNVGVFEHQIIEFRPKLDPDKAEIHILTGVNGSGKSTILYALASAFIGVPHVLLKRFRYEDSRSSLLLSASNSSKQRHVVKIEYDPNNRVSYVNDGHLLEFFRHSVNDSWQGMQTRNFEMAAFAYSGSRTLSSGTITSIFELETNPLSEALNFHNPIDTQQLIQWIANTKAKVAFSIQDNKPKQAENYQTSLRRIESAITEIVGESVEFTFHYDPLGVNVKVADRELEFDLLPDGLKSIISWIADLLMRMDRLKWVDDRDVLDRNFILFLDEIEIHLHPAWQRRILPVVQKLFKNAQIFIATHSPFVVASVSDAWVYRFDVKDGQSQLASVEASKAGSSYVTVLDEVFGIDEFFDPETERDFDEFERLKQEVLKGNHSVIDELLAIAQRLSSKSIEVQDIVGRELRQLQRITQQDLPL